MRERAWSRERSGISPCGLVPGQRLEAIGVREQNLDFKEARIPEPPLLCLNGSGTSPPDAFFR